jgi:hypothetical protein
MKSLLGEIITWRKIMSMTAAADRRGRVSFVMPMALVGQTTKFRKRALK